MSSRDQLCFQQYSEEVLVKTMAEFILGSLAVYDKQNFVIYKTFFVFIF